MGQKALLVVSFGTSYKETCEKTIERVEEKLKKCFPERRFYRAWTSRMIVRKIEKRDGIHIMGVAEAMEAMKRDGITDVLVQSTHLIPGREYDLMSGEIEHFRESFDRIRVGKPLLKSEEDLKRASMIPVRHIAPSKDEMLIFLGHGTEHEANGVYGKMNAFFKEQGFTNCFVGTVDGTPDLADVMDEVRKYQAKKVILTPFLLVAGDHALNDLAGSEPDSWKNVLRSAGYETECVLKGLGEYEEIGEIYLEHALAAEEK